MNPRAFLVRGLLAGLIAGLATFFVGYVIGEPQVEAAIALEPPASTSHHQATSSGDDDAAGPGRADDAGEEVFAVSRTNQSTWGFLTATLAVGVALGGLVSLVAAGVLGRIGRLLPGQSTALVALVGFVSAALVPFLKYPANPPTVSSSDTIGERTALYFGFLLISVVAATLATYAACRLRERTGTFGGVVAGASAYLLVVVVAGQVFAGVDEVGDFPGSLLWSFRLSSLLTLATLWAVLGVVLTGMVIRLFARETAVAERRELAASL